MMMNRYSKNLNNSLKQMNDTSNQIATGRRFLRGSEDPVRALKALQVRRRGEALEQFNFNIQSAEAWLTQTEVAVSAIKQTADKAVDLLIQGRNDSLAIEDRQIIATSLRSLQDQLLKDLNTQLAGKYALGGANTKTVPFVVDSATGHLWYNVFPEFIDETGAVTAQGGGVGGWNVFEMQSIDEFFGDETSVFWDLTGEFQMRDMDVSSILDGLVNRNTVFDIRTLGLQAIGVGPNNLYNLIGRLALAFETDDMKSVDGPVDTDALMQNEIGPDGQDFWALEDYLISKYPNTSDPNPDFPVTQIVGTPPNETKIVRPEMPGHRPYLSTTMQMYLEEDYLRAFDGGDGLFKRLQDRQLNALIELTKVGEKYNYVDYLKTRNEDSMFQMEELQNRLEVMPPDEAILRFKMEDYVYKACLQMSTYIIQPSLMQFLGR